MTPDSLRLVEDALIRLHDQGIRLSSRTKLSEAIAISTGLSSRTALRAFRHLVVDHLIDPTQPSRPRPAWPPPENPHLPAVGQLSDSCPTTGVTPDAAPGAGTVHGRAHVPVRTQAPPATPPPAAPPAPAPPGTPPPPVPPAGTPAGSAPSNDLPPVSVRDLKPSKRMPNKRDGWCVVCEVYVDEEEGFIPLPYDRLAPAPLHCVDCFTAFDELDRAMSIASSNPNNPGVSDG